MMTSNRPWWPFPCDPKLSGDLLDWKMSVRVVSRPYFVDLAHSIGDSHRRDRDVKSIGKGRAINPIACFALASERFASSRPNTMS